MRTVRISGDDGLAHATPRRVDRGVRALIFHTAARPAWCAASGRSGFAVGPWMLLPRSGPWRIEDGAMALAAWCVLVLAGEEGAPALRRPLLAGGACFGGTSHRSSRRHGWRRLFVAMEGLAAVCCLLAAVCCLSFPPFAWPDAAARPGEGHAHPPHQPAASDADDDREQRGPPRGGIDPSGARNEADPAADFGGRRPPRRLWRMKPRRKARERAGRGRWRRKEKTARGKEVGAERERGVAPSRAEGEAARRTPARPKARRLQGRADGDGGHVREGACEPPRRLRGPARRGHCDYEPSRRGGASMPREAAHYGFVGGVVGLSGVGVDAPVKASASCVRCAGVRTASTSWCS